MQNGRQQTPPLRSKAEIVLAGAQPPLEQWGWDSKINSICYRNVHVTMQRKYVGLEEGT